MIDLFSLFLSNIIKNDYRNTLICGCLIVSDYELNQTNIKLHLEKFNLMKYY